MATSIAPSSLVLLPFALALLLGVARGSSASQTVILMVACVVWNWSRQPKQRQQQQQQQDRRFRHEQNQQSCPNPDCVRCCRYREVQRRAHQRLAWILRQHSNPQSLRRIVKSVRLGPSSSPKSMVGDIPQYPSVFFLRGLPMALPIVANESVCAKLLGCREKLREDVRNITIEDWIPNDTPHWSIFPVCNQGVWNESNLNRLSALKRCLAKCGEDLMMNCVFGNIFLSKIERSAYIAPHCGPTNVRHRLQMLVVGGCGSVLKIGRTEEWRWDRGEVVVFDDSIEHSVWWATDPQPEGETGNDKKHDGRKIDYDHCDPTSRIVLIVDLWHPEVKAEERRIIEELYPAARKTANPLIGAQCQC